MPLSGIAEALLQPVFEIVFRVVGTLTGYIVVPIFTLGQVVVGPFQNDDKFLPLNRALKRRSDGRLVLDEDWGAVCGFIFWILISIGCFIYYRYA